ncbi:MAG: site-specific integrase [Ectothiorhodospiraceae bacterium]|nr:site-specific integrase [Ectothiorhodospiraceae bacterium]
MGDTRFAPLIRQHLEVFARLSSVIRGRGMSIRTEKAYLGWVCRFLLYFNRQGPTQLGPTQVGAFLEHLALKRNVAASTQNHTHVLNRGGLAVRSPLNAP